jgi:acetyl/propionyl-CoA carboxylase alpha subunit
VEKLTMALTFSIGGEATNIEIIRRRPRLVLRIGRRDYEVTEEARSGPRHRLRIDGESIDFAAVSDGNAGFVRLRGRTWQVSLLDPRQAAGNLDESLDDIRAPMPGVVVSVHKREGDAVLRGEAIVTIESMKLQMALAAPRDGIVASLSKKAEEAVDKDELVATLVAAGDAE